MFSIRSKGLASKLLFHRDFRLALSQEQGMSVNACKASLILGYNKMLS